MKNITIKTILIASISLYAAIYIYQRYKRKKANESIDTEQDALDKLNEAKESIL